jgi:hypothetical protein
MERGCVARLQIPKVTFRYSLPGDTLRLGDAFFSIFDLQPANSGLFLLPFPIETCIVPISIFFGLGKRETPTRSLKQEKNLEH